MSCNELTNIKRNELTNIKHSYTIFQKNYYNNYHNNSAKFMIAMGPHGEIIGQAITLLATGG